MTDYELQAHQAFVRACRRWATLAFIAGAVILGFSLYKAWPTAQENWQDMISLITRHIKGALR